MWTIVVLPIVAILLVAAGLLLLARP